MLHDQVAVVTGGASGIGLAYTKSLLKDGIRKVYILDINSKIGLDSASSLKKDFGEERVAFLKADVSDFADLEGAVQQIIAEAGVLNIFVNNAGVLLAPPLKIITLNVMGVLNGITLALKYMAKNCGGQGGVVVNTASVAGLVGLPEMPVYAASKCAIIGLTTSYGDSFYYNSSGIKFMAICPGFTVTPLLAAAKRQVSSDPTSVQRKFADTCLAHGSQGPEVVGNVLIKVLQEDINGAIWIVEGGESYSINIPEYRTFRS